MSRMIAALVMIACAWIPATLAGEGELQVHPLFTDHMVLQRGRDTPVWGTAAPDATVKVSFVNDEAETKADATGRWQVTLPPQAAGGPHQMSIRSGETIVLLDDVLVGDVWLCSGQSNMEMGVGACLNAKEEIAAANYPKIRLYRVPKHIALKPESTFDSHWEVCSPETVAKPGWGGFSAAAYFFGRHLHNEIGVPIGLIQAAWGGTVAEAWTSAQALSTMEDFRDAVDSLDSMRRKIESGEYDFEQEMRAWWDENDPGRKDGISYAATEFDDAEWEAMNLPANWEKAGIDRLAAFDGLVWFRRAVEIPADWAGKTLTLSLGPVDDFDMTYFNGEPVGHMEQWNLPRVYTIPADKVKAGRAVIAVAALDTGGGGGLFGQAGQMTLAPADANGMQPLPLAGEWRYRIALEKKDVKDLPRRFDRNPNAVTVLFNGMIAPLQPLAIKGAIWYQGEANSGRPLQYRALLPTMIRDWRSRFSGGEFPFLIVQLAGFTAPQKAPSEGNWALLREAQWMTAQQVPNAALACASDIGEAGDIHPKNKQEVGRRLGLAAQALAYGQDIVYSGPAFREMKIEDGKARLFFDHTGGGLVATGGTLEGFAIAGAEGPFVWAEAVIDGQTVVVSSPDVAQPAAVRYGWGSNPKGNLYNKEGLPAITFRTDPDAKR